MYPPHIVFFKFRELARLIKNHWLQAKRQFLELLLLKMDLKLSLHRISIPKMRYG